jgi:hypothetical protein
VHVNEEIKGSIAFLQPYPVTLAVSLLETYTVIISAVMSPDEHLSQGHFLYRDFITSRCIIVLFGTSSSGYALLNASQTAANDFGVK